MDGLGQERRRVDRTKANERYRHEFLTRSANELRELAALLAEEPDAGDSAAFELERLAQTAGSLDLPIVAQAANEAAGEVQQGAGGRALRKVAHAIRHAAGRVRFGPIVVVGLPAEDAERVRTESEQVAEPVLLYEDVSAFLHALQPDEPNVVVLPASALELVSQLVQRESFPVLVHGGHHAAEAFTAALAVGARGYLVHPVPLSEILAVARVRSQPVDEPTDVLVVAGPSPERDQLLDGLRQVGLAGHAAAEPSSVLLALDEWPIKAVIVWIEVQGQPSLPYVQLVRAHPRYNHLPILVYAHAEEANALRALGAEDAMRVDVSPSQAAQRVRERIDRLLALPWTRDPASGVSTRLGVLAAIDDELARASRSGAVVTVAHLEVEGLRSTDLDHGAVHRARRLLGEIVRRNVRKTDPIGELAIGELVVCLPGCLKGVAERRMAALAKAFATNVAADPELAGLRLAYGVADNLDGAPTVARRAEQALRRA